MNNPITGRASKIEERGIKNQELVAAGLPPARRGTLVSRSPQREEECQREQKLRYARSSKPIGYRNKLSFEDYEKHFTRDYAPRFYKPQVLEAELKGAGERKSDWPAFAEAMNSTLLTGQNEDETTIFNCTAIWLLREIRRLTELTGQQEKHDNVRSGSENSSAGFGHDSLRDMGPAAAMIISKWCDSDVQPATEGKKPKSQPRVTSKAVHKAWKARTGAVVDSSWIAGKVEIETGADGAYYPRSVGDIRFDERLHMTEFSSGVDKDGKKKWLRFLERTRSSKKNNSFVDGIRALTKQMEDARARYLTANGTGSLPHKNDFMAGKVEPRYSEKSKASPDDNRSVWADLDPDGENTFHRRPQSSHDPFVTERAAEEAHDYAAEELERYRRIMTDIPYEAFVDAAMGMRLDECGDGPRGNKQASARGRDRIHIAVMNFLRSEVSAEPLYLEMAA